MPNDLQKAVRLWLEKAPHDLCAAETMLVVDDPPIDVCCYHAQQCLEKLLKACLVAKRRLVPRSHDLVYLLECRLEYDPDLDELKTQARELTDDAVETHYPFTGSELTIQDGRDAIAAGGAASKRLRVALSGQA